MHKLKRVPMRVGRLTEKTSRFEVVVGVKHALRADEFSEFLMLFNKAYALGISLPDRRNKVLRKSRHRELLLEQLRRSRGIRGPTSPLIIARIRKSSPVRLTFKGVAPLLVLAVILSGGKVDLSMGRFEVPSLGYGLKMLREAFPESEKRPSKETPKGGHVHRIRIVKNAREVSV